MGETQQKAIVGTSLSRGTGAYKDKGSSSTIQVSQTPKNKIKEQKSYTHIKTMLKCGKQLYRSYLLSGLLSKRAIVNLPPPPFTKLLLSSACCKSQWATPSTTRSSLSFLKACGQDFKSQAPAIAVTRFFDREFGPNHPMHFHFHFHLGAQKTISQHTIHLYYINVHVFASRFFKCSQVPSHPHLHYSPTIP